MVGIKLREAETRASQVREQGGGEGRGRGGTQRRPEGGWRAGGSEIYKTTITSASTAQTHPYCSFQCFISTALQQTLARHEAQKQTGESFHWKTQRDPSISSNLASLASSLSLRRSSSNHNLISAFRAIDPARPLNYPPRRRSLAMTSELARGDLA